MAQCACPPNAALPTISNQDCPEKFGNINKFVIGRIAGGSFVDITDETEFDTRLAAVDATKIIITPFLSDTTFPSTAIIETAKDDNSSPFGEGFRVGEGSVTVTANLKNLESSIKDELKGLECYTDLAIAIVDSNGTIAATSTTDLIPISNLFIGSKSFGGISETDNIPISFTLRPNWDEGLVKSTLAWDIFTK